MKSETEIKSIDQPKAFIEGVDFYFEKGLMVLTAHFLRKRGYCCQNGCRNCPFDKAKDKTLQ